MRKNKTSRKVPGALIVITGMGLGYWQVSKQFGDREGPVSHGFTTVQGTYLGWMYNNGANGLAVNTGTSVLFIEVDKRIHPGKRLPQVGGGIKVTFNHQDPAHPRVLRAKDINAGVVETNLYIPKDETSQPWAVRDGWARNGFRVYPTELPDGDYTQLKGVLNGSVLLAKR
jgi:hypothetical protein